MTMQSLRGLASRILSHRMPFGRGAYQWLDALYADEDPWSLAGAPEQERFAQTNAIVAAEVPNCQSLLEIGAGEGYQTSHLVRLAKQVTALDVSGRAIRRAQRRAPSARFLRGAAEDLPRLVRGERFDIVTACEMLYYVPEPQRVLAVAQSLSPLVLTTNFVECEAQVASHVAGQGWHRLPDIKAGALRWRCDLWRGNRAQ